MDDPTAHSRLEDGMAIFVGCVMVSMGVELLRASGLITGSAVGLALLLSYWLPLSPGTWLAIMSVPVLLASIRSMGGLFAFRTIAGIVGIAIFSRILEDTAHIGDINPAIAAIVAGTLLGMGGLAFGRHGAGVGVAGLIAIWLQQARGWNAGRTHLVIDALVLGASAVFLTVEVLVWSSLCAFIMGCIIWLWFREGRYNGVSPARIHSAGR